MPLGGSQRPDDLKNGSIKRWLNLNDLWSGHVTFGSTRVCVHRKAQATRAVEPHLVHVQYGPIEFESDGQTDENGQTVLQVFQACPEWLYLLAKQPPPGRCRFDSITVKELERRLDGLVVPESHELPVTVFEFQFQKDAEIYNRIVVEMAAAERAHDMRTVQGIIFFRSESLDDKPEPWRRIVQSVSMQDALDELERMIRNIRSWLSANRCQQRNLSWMQTPLTTTVKSNIARSPSRLGRHSSTCL